MSNNVLIENKKGYKKTKLGWIPEDWDIFKFSSIFERVNRRNCENNNNILTISANYGLVNQEKYFNKVVASSDTSNYLLLYKGEFAYNKSYSSKYPMGAIKLLEKYEKGIVSNLYICFVNKPNINFSKQFFKFYFDAGRLNSEIYKIAQEGARNHGLLNMSTNDFFNTNIIIPTNIKEQEKIAEILSAWDDGIETLEKLIEQKEVFHKALMKNLLIGKIRLSEFSLNTEYKRTKLGPIPIDWQIKPLKLLFDKRMQKYSGNTEHNIFTNSATKGVVLQNEYFDRSIVTEENTNNYYVVGENDFMYNPRISQSAPAGPINRNKLGITGIASPLYTIFKAKNDTFIDFYEQYFSSNLWNNSMFMVANQGARHDRLNITSNDFMNMPLPYPPIKEQEKIANILIESYKEIQILNSKLEKLKEQKKGLMQKLLTGQIRVKV